MRGLRILPVAAAFALAVLVTAGASSAPNIDHRRFMAGFARFVDGVIADEGGVRARLDTFILKDKTNLSAGVGIHPELIPEMYSLAGTERLDCLSGRYFTAFQMALTNEEREAFYKTKHDMDRWVLMLAVEEAARLKVTNPSPPLSYRLREDIPAVIADEMRATVAPYIAVKPGKEVGAGPGFRHTGAGFDDLTCN